MSGGIDIRALLEERDACGNGIEDAIAVFGPVLPSGVSLAWAVAVAAGEPWLCRRVGWAVGRLVKPEDVGVVAGADLSRADLRRADLSDANLGRANLSDADLSDADFGRADLSGADLSDADLAGANLRGANLRGADLRGADLRRANLRRANLANADFGRADLWGAKLQGALRAPEDPPISGWALVDGRLRRAS